MRASSLLLVAGGLALSAVAFPSESRACGGCFHLQQSEGGQVTGHRMVVSVSKDATTLWDQISYAGNPESFAWVLPIHGQVEIGLSSDAMFEQLEDITRVQILSTQINCPTPNDCFSTGGGGPGGTETSSFTGPEVTVIAQETVGPYETAQLEASDPLALEAWLDGHGYVIPADVQPILTAYIAEGFDFLVMKLVPGEGVSSMRPVRVTSPGAGLSLPLRMVAAGTGATTPISLWVLSEGRYEPANFPSFTIATKDLVWDWDTKSSNYKKLKMDGYAATGGEGWLIEAAFPTSPKSSIGAPLSDLAGNDWSHSGYGTDETTAIDELIGDLDALYGSLDPASFWVTRMRAELPKAALDKDLTLGAAAEQVTVPSVMTISANHTVGTPPMCPPVSDCGGSSGSGGSGAASNTTTGGSGAGSNSAQEPGGCGVSPPDSGVAGTALLAALAALGAAVFRRRRR
ncbi:MAG: DUF2330 domain-containing protein [Polyangiaceae bacterium]